MSFVPLIELKFLLFMGDVTYVYRSEQLKGALLKHTVFPFFQVG